MNGDVIDVYTYQLRGFLSKAKHQELENRERLFQVTFREFCGPYAEMLVYKEIPPFSELFLGPNEVMVLVSALG
jgi:hypothetical protein